MAASLSAMSSRSTFPVEELFDMEASDIDRMEKTPLALFSTYKLSMKLNRELLFLTQSRSQLSCGDKRDWKGLEDYCLNWRNDRGEPGLTNDEKPISQLQKQDPTSHIINKWSKRKGVFVKDLLDCLVNIDRYDIIEEVLEDMKECCRNHESNISDAHQWITETHTTTTTIRDLKALKAGEPLPKNYVLILHGNDEKSLEFTPWFVERLEKIFRETNADYEVCLPSRDFMVGSIEKERISDMIKKRCNKVIALLSPSFQDNYKLKYQLDDALEKNYDMNRENPRSTAFLLPIKYEKCELGKEVESLHLIHYDEKSKLFNFWDKLMLSFEIKNLTSEQKAMNFHGFTNDIEEKSTSNENGSSSRSSSGANFVPYNHSTSNTSTETFSLTNEVMGKRKQKAKNRLSFEGFKDTFSKLKNRSKYRSMSRSASYGANNSTSVPDSMISNLTIESRISDSAESTATFSTFNDGAMALPTPPDHDPKDDEKRDAQKTKKKIKSPAQAGS